mmetsp:Transcript_119127/g.207347  ORF Transcript_119127/g.207347 Transcript_119127/m.207347 type:complete len:180 (-) Transcript_119127:728-1267(-)
MVDCSTLEKLWEDLVHDWLTEELQKVDGFNLSSETLADFKANLYAMVKYNLLKDMRSLIAQPKTKEALGVARVTQSEQRLFASRREAATPGFTEQKQSFARSRRQQYKELQASLQQEEEEEHELKVQEEELKSQLADAQAESLVAMKHLQEFSDSLDLPVEELNSLKATMLALVYSGWG